MTALIMEECRWGVHREYGSNWPRLIGVATGAAMRAERDAMGEV